MFNALGYHNIEALFKQLITCYYIIQSVRVRLAQNIIVFLALTFVRGKLNKMCIIFIYNGYNDPQSDYSLIVVANRDESYDRPSKNMDWWSGDVNVIGGLDLGVNCTSTWLAVSPLRKKIGVLLNLPGYVKENALSRGKIVSGYVTSEKCTKEYIPEIQMYDKQCNGFVFVSIEFGTNKPIAYAYSNVSNDLSIYTDNILGFGNSLPHKPLTKVEDGTKLMHNICKRLNKVDKKQELIDELINLMRLKESHLPDAELESRRPAMYKELSSIFVCVPVGRYGSRTHTILLLSKTGHADLIEMTMRMSIDPTAPIWDKTEFQFQV